ncbi:hypothetical protein MHH60_00800 [Paenibacillus sp. FSL H7-0716]|uniref:ABC transporter permease n=1 Tax=Paenibacillus odorifer TaxID=189426 RepID=A0AB36JC45_9BACL|nr:hypothetical protein [Paenibacillus odorifer]OME20094.1 hypothetical protein BSK47_13255 [Paenibacillus odorifer]
MNEIEIVFRMQLKEYFKDKGALIFHLCAVVLIGIVAPVFRMNDTVLLSASILFPLILLKQWTANSFAGEKEMKTIETLLSSPIKSKSLFYGKCMYCFFSSGVYYLSIFILILLVKSFTKEHFQMNFWEWVGMLILCIQILLTVTLIGVDRSITSDDIQMANSKLTVVFYPIYIYIVILINLFTQHLMVATYLLSAVFLVVLMGVNSYFIFIKVKKMNRSYFFAESYKKVGVSDEITNI